MTAWTQEMRDKAAATRAATKAKKEARLAKKEARARFVNGNGGGGQLDRATAGDENAMDNGAGIIQHAEIASSTGGEVEENVSDFDWEEAPLSQAMSHAAEMKREYERVAQIIVRRQNPPKQMWTCWSQENKELVPKSVLAQCLKRGEDGKWKFRDDGRFVVEDGVRRLKPAFCCNFLCYAVYQKNRVTPPAREAQQQAVR